MKIYPNADVSFYIDKNSCWGSYLKHGPNQHWKERAKPFEAKHMYYWRDIEGTKLVEVKKKDLYFENPPKSRIRRQACLGMLYATGQRFIKLSMAPPVNFKCAPLPVNLQTARLVKSKWEKLDQIMNLSQLKFIRNFRVAKGKGKS